LSFKYFGPFIILEKIGPAAYRLQLPDNCLIYPVFHVSQLKRAIPSNTPVSSELPDISNQMQVPLKVLDRRLRQHQQTMIPQVLVRWSYLPEALSTWEDEETLRQQFPRAPAWGQAGSQGGGGVTPATSPVIAADKKSEDDDTVAGGVLQKDASDRGVTTLERMTRSRRPNPRMLGPEWAK
jgi:hypothetical protein